MIELALIGLQILFIFFIFNFSVYEITNKINIKYLNIFEIMFLNILFLLNILFFLSILNLTINYIFFIIISLTILGFIKSIKNKKYELIKNVNFIIILFILSFIISIDLAKSIEIIKDKIKRIIIKFTFFINSYFLFLILLIKPNMVNDIIMKKM